MKPLLALMAAVLTLGVPRPRPASPHALVLVPNPGYAGRYQGTCLIRDGAVIDIGFTVDEDGRLDGKANVLGNRGRGAALAQNVPIRGAVLEDLGGSGLTYLGYREHYGPEIAYGSQSSMSGHAPSQKLGLPSRFRLRNVFDRHAAPGELVLTLREVGNAPKRYGYDRRLEQSCVLRERVAALGFA